MLKEKVNQLKEKTQCHNNKSKEFEQVIITNKLQLEDFKKIEECML